MTTLDGLLDTIQSSIPSTIHQILQNSSSFSTFLNLTVQSNRVNEILTQQDDITLFAPTEIAFRLFSKQVEANMYPNLLYGSFLSDDDSWDLHVENVLLHHFLPSRYLLADLASSPSPIIAMNDEEIETMAEQQIIKTYGEDRWTISKLGSLVVPDIVARNGIIHVVDQLLLPTWLNMTIFDIASADPDQFSTFLSLADWTGVTNLLSSSTDSFNGPYTVFLPTNDAFEQLASAMGTNLATLDVDYVTDILLYHVVLGVHRARNLTVGLEMTSLLSFESIVVTSPLDMVGVDGMINDVASIIHTDILANNGIVHVMSSVVLPTQPDPYLEDCLTRKAIEETLGSSPEVLDVSCTCYRPPGRDVRNVILSCTETFGSTNNIDSSVTVEDEDGMDVVGPDDDDAGVLDREGGVGELDVDAPDRGSAVAIACTARDMFCTSTHQCCSAPLRKCSDGKCTDLRNFTVVTSSNEDLGDIENNSTSSGIIAKGSLREGVNRNRSVASTGGSAVIDRERYIRGGGR
jgi:uncharacterized surface protein with fasciclin (FAS1) repeats